MNPHEAAIDRLIPQAEKFANRGVVGMPHETEAERLAWSSRWTELFHGEMDRLASAAGLRETVRTTLAAVTAIGPESAGDPTNETNETLQ